MATRFSNTLHWSVQTAPLLQAIAQFIEDTLVTTGGWVVTSDTGQTLPSAMAINGYRIYKMNDALSATYPVVMKITQLASEFGPTPKLGIAVGMGSDGAGNITDKIADFTCLVSANGADSGTATNSYGSANPGRACFGLFITSSQGWAMVFSIERSKNALGEDTGDGLLLTGSSYNGIGLSANLYAIYGKTTQPTLEAGLSYILTTQNPSQTLGGSIGVGVLSHFKGIAQQPGLALIVVNSADVPSEGQFILNIYGANHTYQHLGNLYTIRGTTGAIGSGGGISSDLSTRVAMRYD